ncbi:DUF1048 domain-containing protein [Clostridium sp. SHJSY1]|uniref:DUF1048 domain-containing protein n=1 Tax=Clostridium sp. SHJSY1 TaxID=2942483 RepID=UPI0028740389|nr:DUF1048 domain-containing protein [Clostridium sp. SHJSY1]MDS0525189.1 DUF1048 domain-containing protein [Clostridium sp. SHJSY1]
MSIVGQLKGEYKESYLKIVLYLSSSNIPREFQHEVSEDVKDLLISAQEDEMDVKNIVGDNIEKFCKEIIKSKKFKNKNLFYIVDSIYFALFMLILSSLALWVLKSPMSLNMIFIYIIDYIFATFIFTKWLRKGAILTKRNTKRIILMILFFIIFMILGAIVNFVALSNYVIHINSLYTEMVLIITFIFTNVVRRKLKASLREQCNLS